MRAISAILWVTLLSTGCDFHHVKEPQSGSGGRADSPHFAAVGEILKIQCAGCHAAFPTYSESTWISMSYVIPERPNDSLLYRRLKGSKTGGVENMPQGGALSSAELAIFQDWINTIDSGGKTDTGGDGGALTAVQRTSAALAVLAKVCTSCHSTSQTAASSEYLGTRVPAFGNFEEDADFVIGGLASPGDPNGSWILRALKEYGTIGTMPNASDAISVSDQESLEKWIEQMGEA